MPDPGFAPEDTASVRVDDLDGVVVVRVSGEIDLATEATVGRPLTTCLDSAPHAVVIDLSQVEFMGSTGLTMLVQAYHRCRRDAIAMGIVADRYPALRALEITGLDNYLPVHRSTTAALTAVRAATAENADTVR